MSNNVIIIPSFNPDNSLIELVKELKNKFKYIIVVNDGTDERIKNIFDKVKDEGVSVVSHSSNLGKGEAIKTGVREASKLKDVPGFITVDCDGQHVYEDVIKIDDAINKDGDSVVLGIRNISGKNVPIRSKIVSFISYLYFMSETGKKCNDTYSGLRGIPVKYKDLFFEVEGTRFEYELNFLLEVVNKGINLKYVDINTIYINNNKGSNYRTFRDTFRMYKKIIAFVCSSISSSLVDIVGFAILEFLGISIMMATFIARIFSGVMNFGLNKNFAFSGKGDNKFFTKQLFLYGMLFVGKMVLSALFVSLLSFIPLNLVILKVIVDVGLFYLGYVIQNKYIFV